MAPSDQEDRAIFEHLLRNVLDLGQFSSLECALIVGGISQVSDIVAFSDDDVNAIKYVDGPRDGSNLMLGDKVHLRVLKQFILCIQSLNADADMMATSTGDFDLFYMNPEHFKSTYVPVPKVNNSSPSNPETGSVLPEDSHASMQ